MSGSSKQRQEIVEQLANELRKKERGGADIGFFERLREFVTSPKKSNWELVRKATITNKEVETRKFVICFDYLNEDECHYGEFNSAKGRALVALLKQVADCEVKDFPATRIVRDTVRNTGEYQPLFRNLSPDVDKLQEAEMGGGRIFFFISDNKFNIVSIESNHRNTER